MLKSSIFILKNTNKKLLRITTSAILLGGVLLLTNVDTYAGNSSVVRAQGVADSERAVSGVVLDETNMPLPGASVTIKGTVKGTITDIDGKFSIEAASSDTLVFSSLGLETQEISVGNQASIDILMVSKSEMLTEFVVTALGIKKDEKVLGYSMQQVGSEELTESGNPNVMGALEGKVAGVEVTSSSTGLGGTNKIVIRGNSSIAGNNDPLWIVDGIPFDNNSNVSASEYGGYDRGSAAVDINPDDIESMSVLKGPAAAALYGSKAGNGVIIVTTKRGSKKDVLGVDFSANLTVDQLYGGLDMQNTYGRGTGGVSDNRTNASWGAKMEGQPLESWTGEVIPYSSYDNKEKEFYNNGYTQNYNLGIGKGDEDQNYRMGISYVNAKGVVPNQTAKRLNADLSGSTSLNKILSVDSKVSLSQSKTKNRIYYGKYGAANQLLLMPRNIRLQDLQNYSSDERNHVNWTGGAPNIDLRNPYYVLDQYQNMEVRDRVFGYGSVKAELHSLLNIAFKQSLDLYTTDFDSKIKDEGLTPFGTEGSMYGITKSKYRQTNSELLITGQKLIPAFDIDFSYLAGANRTHYTDEVLYAGAKNLYRNDFNISAGQDVTEIPKQYLSEKEIQSVFGSAQFYYKSMVNLEITARNDWSSALPSNNNSYFYPSVNTGLIISEMLDQLGSNPTWLSFAKVRLSWAMVGKDMQPHQLENAAVYQRDGAIEDNISIKPDSDTKKNPNLKPELSTSREVGLDLRFFQNRLGADFTYYNSYTVNQIIKVPNDGIGYNYKYINAGKVLNNGIELSLYATPVKTNDFTFDVNLNLAKRYDFVEELEPGKPDNYQTMGENDMIKVVAQTGEKLGQIIAKRSYERDVNGNIIVDDNGLPKVTGGERVIGDIQPDFTGSLRTTFSYKNFSLTGLFNFKKGGDIVSVSEAIASEVGNSKITENRDGFVFGGVVLDADKNYVKDNDVAVSTETFYRHVGSITGIAEEFLYDASYIKLGEIAFSYNINKALLAKTPVNSLKLSIIGRNLFYLYKNTPGTFPDGGFDMFSQAHDFSSIPTTRNIGFSITAKF